MLAKAELNYYPEETVEKKHEENQENRKNNRRNNKKRKRKTLFKLGSISTAILFMFSGLFVLRGYANITEIRMKVTELENKKVELEKQKMNLIADVESIKKSSKINEDAAYKLGMVSPSRDQIVYINIEDNLENESKNTKQPKIWGRVLSVFSK